MKLLPLGFLLLSTSLKACARPSPNTTTANDDFDVTCFRRNQRFPSLRYMECLPLLQYLDSFTDLMTYWSIDFPQTYRVREAPRCLVVINVLRPGHDVFPGSEFGTAAQRVLIECHRRSLVHGDAFGGSVAFRPSKNWVAEVKGMSQTELENGVGMNQTLGMRPPNVAVD